MPILDDVLTLVFPNKDASDNQRQLLTKIVEITNDRMMGYLPSSYEEVPKKLNYIVVEVSVKRFNRIGSEGMQSESVEGRSAIYNKNDFDEYLDDIKRFLDKENADELEQDRMIRFLWDTTKI